MGSLQSFRIKLLGYSFAGVERLAMDLKARLERIPRVNVGHQRGQLLVRRRAVTRLTLIPDRAALARSGSTASDFAAAVAREVAGAAGRQRLELGDEELWLSLKATGARTARWTSCARRWCPTRGAPGPGRRPGARGRARGLASISREDQQYVRIVSYDFRGPAKLANRTHDAFMKSITVPAGYSVSDEQFGWEDDESEKGLWLVFARA